MLIFPIVKIDNNRNDAGNLNRDWKFGRIGEYLKTKLKFIFDVILIS